jgi:hypothetical protein
MYSSGYRIRCGCCGISEGVEKWLDSAPVATGACHFQCPHCLVKIRRVTHGVKTIKIDDSAAFVPERISIEVVA